jgi:hypothetical protein
MVMIHPILQLARGDLDLAREVIAHIAIRVRPYDLRDVRSAIVEVPAQESRERCTRAELGDDGFEVPAPDRFDVIHAGDCPLP